ncbi:cyanophycinase [Tautonia rosea]|uniref:cyanophycinase n=1 Tax=Tautonia rosea TaxID=2728037 RepID=UPI001474CD2F|nr:cyanophycinase [Tautonia rosea]
MQQLIVTLRISIVFGLLIALASPIEASEGIVPARINPDGIAGALVIVGGGRIPQDVTDTFRSLAGADARLVVIPTASASADEEPDDEWIDLWRQRGFDYVTVLHTRDRDRANDPEFVAPIKEATAVWFGGGDQSRIASAYLGTAVEEEVFGVLERGGVVGGTSAGAAIMTQVMITGGNPNATVGEGFNLLPDAVVDQHFLARNRKPRLQGVLNEHPETFGVGIDESTALVVVGRRLEVVGQSSVTILVPASNARHEREITLKSGDVADLTALRRSVRDRANGDFPPEVMNPPKIDAGALVIVGGGGLPGEVLDRFVSLAGGPEARIVVVPTASEGRISPIPHFVSGVKMFEERGVRSVGVLYGRHPEEIETPEQLAMLREATGIWFGGGRQWRFVDCYEGTSIVPLFHDVLRRGGVIGGSSAGATIQGDYLVRGNPLGNWDMMAEGYERGFAFLPGVAIDQHYSQRNRFDDLAAVVNRFPQVLGLGIDEGTALIVEGSTGEVLGRGAVHVLSQNHSGNESPPITETLEAGSRFNLVDRIRVEPAIAAEGQ